jgi:hypothetical protein
MAASIPLRNQDLNGLADQHLAAIAKQPLRFRIGPLDHSLAVDDHHPVWSGFDQRIGMGLDALEAAAQQHLLGDVARNQHQALGIASRASARGDDHMGREVAGVLANPLDRALPRVLIQSADGDLGRQATAHVVLSVKHPPRPADDLRRRIAV